MVMEGCHILLEASINEENRRELSWCSTKFWKCKNPCLSITILASQISTLHLVSTLVFLEKLIFLEIKVYGAILEPPSSDLGVSWVCKKKEDELIRGDLSLKLNGLYIHIYVLSILMLLLLINDNSTAHAATS